MIPLRHSSLILLVGAIMSGCFYAPSDPSGWGYVLDKGGPDEIGAWAMRQTEARKIDAASFALFDIAMGDRGYSKASAIDQMIAIHVRMRAGWPGFEPRAGSSAEEQMRQYVLRDYGVFAAWALEGHELMRHAFYAVKPPPMYPDLLTPWEAERMRLEQ